MLRQLIITAVAGFVSALLLGGPAAAGSLKATVHSVAPATFGSGGSATANSGMIGVSGTGLPGNFGLSNFTGTSGSNNGASDASDKFYIGSSSNGAGSYNLQITKKILSF